jgi:shikimate dehydrogenase
MTGRPARRAAVLGSPIAHSRSPRLHRAAYAYLGLPWRYDAIEVTAAGLADFLRGLDDEWVGLSLTMPLKETVRSLLDDSDPLVDRTGSANTVVLREGRRLGFNTDVAGLAGVLRDHEVAAAARAAVLGAGATARSAMAALELAGVSDVRVVARRAAAATVVTDVAGHGMTTSVVPWSAAALAAVADDCDVVISTVPAPASDAMAAAWGGPPLRGQRRLGLLVDVVYDPWPTAAADAWARRGGEVVGGQAMLVGQALEQVRLMTGEPVPAEVLWAALRA